jgi:hypothetical protein
MDKLQSFGIRERAVGNESCIWFCTLRYTLQIKVRAQVSKHSPNLKQSRYCIQATSIFKHHPALKGTKRKQLSLLNALNYSLNCVMPFLKYTCIPGQASINWSKSLRKMPSSGVWRRVDVVDWTDVSEDRIASIFRVEKSASEEPAW